jgi:hypothetical protein
MLRHIVLVSGCAATLAFVASSVCAEGRFATAGEAKALLEKAVAAVTMVVALLLKA